MEKYCQFCGNEINVDAVVCVNCGRQVSDFKSNVTSDSVLSAINSMLKSEEKRKDVALVLCLFGGTLGLHKFYEQKHVLGILYLLTGGFFLIGVLIDLVVLLSKDSTYYVN